MGKEINSELKYHKYLDEVQGRLYNCKGTEIDALLDNDFLYDYLGIRVSCFMVYDSLEERYVLYQNNFLDESGKFYPRIPFKIKNKHGKFIREYEPIIDLVFIGNRHPMYKNKAYPEFHNYFQTHDIDAISKIVMHEYWDENNEPIPDTKFSALGIFHRKTGEILFFLYAWRYLVRYYSRVDGDKEISTFDEFYFEKSEIDKDSLLVNYKDWLKKTTGFDFLKLVKDFQENIWLKKDDSHTDEQQKKEQEESKNQHEEIDKAFEEYIQYEFNQPTSFDFISIEWKTLGINPKHERGCCALKSLLEYAMLILAKSKANDEGNSNTKNIIQNVINKINNKEEISLKDKLEIHRSLTFIFYVFLKEAFGILFPEKKCLANSIVDYLDTFLNIIKFPIFPYFLELFFEKNSDDPNDDHEWHRPKEHLVFPIWYSNSNQINKGDIEHNSRYVAYVLLSLEPVWSRAIGSSGDEANYEPEELNIHKIKTFFHIISKSLIENGFYNSVVKKQLLLPATKAAISQYMCRNLSHNLGSHSIPQFNLLLNKKIYSANKADYWKKDELYKIRGYNEYIQGRMEFLAEFSSKSFSELYIEYSIKNICEKLKSSINENPSEEGSGEYEIVFKGMIDSLDRENLNTLKIEIGNIPTGIEIVDIRGDNLGIQAFYLIIENVIRNLYKHSKPALLGEKPAIRFYIQISEPEDLEVRRGFYAIDIIDRHGFRNSETRDDRTLEKINSLIRQKILDDKNNTLRNEGWGMLEMKSAAAYLLGLPIEYVDAKHSNHIKVNGEIYPYPLEASFHRDEYLDSDKNLGYRFYLPKSKFCLIDKEPPSNESELKEIGIEFGSIEGGRHKFFISNSTSSFKNEFINQRIVNIKQFSTSILNNLSKQNEKVFKTTVWQEYLTQYDSLKFKRVVYARDGKMQNVINPENLIVYDVHAVNIICNGISSSCFSKEKLFPAQKRKLFYYYESYPSKCDFSDKIDPVDEPYLSMLKETASLRIAIFDERIQESSYTVDDQKYDKESISAAGEQRLMWRDILLSSGVYIPSNETVDLLKLVKEKDSSVQKGELGEKDKLVKHLKESIKNNDYLIVHFTLVEILLGTTDKTEIGKQLQQFIIANKLNESNKALVLISGRGRPSNLPEGYFFANYTTIEECVGRNRSKLRLVTILKSLRKRN